jgi:hypothetical protein
MAATAAALAFALAGCAHMAASGGGAAGGTGWKTLFDGSNGLASFTQTGDANWRVEGGTIVADHGSGFLVTKEDYGDFAIRVEFYVESDTNSGIFLRCKKRDGLDSNVCYEVNIWDDRPVQKYGTGAIVDIAAVEPTPHAGGKWNTYEITARGDHLVVMLNGVKTADVHNPRNTRGPIGLQYAPGNKKNSGLPVKFRNVQVRPL